MYTFITCVAQTQPSNALYSTDCGHMAIVPYMTYSAITRNSAYTYYILYSDKRIYCV